MKQQWIHWHINEKTTTMSWCETETDLNIIHSRRRVWLSCIGRFIGRHYCCHLLLSRLFLGGLVAADDLTCSQLGPKTDVKTTFRRPILVWNWKFVRMFLPCVINTNHVTKLMLLGYEVILFGLAVKYHNHQQIKQCCVNKATWEEQLKYQQ